MAGAPPHRGLSGDGGWESNMSQGGARHRGAQHRKSPARTRRRREQEQALSAQPRARHDDLSECIEGAVLRYFQDLNGQRAGNLYRVFIAEVERAFFTAVMRQCKGNLSEATRMLGMHRATLRKRLRCYGLCKTTRNSPAADAD